MDKPGLADWAIAFSLQHMDGLMDGALAGTGILADVRGELNGIPKKGETDERRIETKQSELVSHTK